jgi:hypothetical protein
MKINLMKGRTKEEATADGNGLSAVFCRLRQFGLLSYDEDIQADFKMNTG